MKNLHDICMFSGQKTIFETRYICLQFPDEFEQRDISSLPPGLRAPAPMM